VWFKNLSLKVTAVGLAVLLWFHVATNRVYDYPVTVPLSPGILPSKFALASPLPEHVRLQVSGTGKELIRLLLEDGKAELLLEPHMTGSYAITSGRLLLQAGADVEIQQVLDPIALDIEVDSVVVRRLPVRYQGEWALSSAMALSRPPEVVPESVEVRGPRMLVERLGGVATRSVDLGVLSASMQTMLGLDLGESNSLSASPDSVRVRFVLEPSATRQLGPVPVTAPDGWRAVPPQVTLTVAGAAAQLESLAAADCRATARADIAGDSARWAEVRVEVPAHFRLVGVDPPRVRLTPR
jgi:hypothetical protein